MAKERATVATLTDFDRVRRVFQLELERGGSDQLVIGGLDRMLIQMVEDGAISDALRKRIAALPDGGYRSLGAEARQSWLRGTLGALENRPAPQPVARPATSKPTPIRPARGHEALRGRHGKVVAIRPGVAADDALPDDQDVREPSTPLSASSLKLESPLQRLPGLGKANAARFEKLDVHTAGDLVTLFPRRFNDFRDLRKIRDVRPGAMPQTIVAQVVSMESPRFGRMRRTEALVTDGTGFLRVVWFNQTYISRAVGSGDTLALSGKVREWRGRLQMDNPEFEPLDAEMLHTGRLVPVYPATQGLGQKTIRRAVKVAVDALADRVPDPIPDWLREKTGLPAQASAIRTYHYPETPEQAEEARQRLALGEFLAIQSAVLMRRAEWQQGNDAPVLSLGERLPDFIGSLPFALTPAQQRCLDEILRDIRGPHPMLRLLQGDVGSGKTVLAFAAAFAAVASGYQAAIMAPTEILAEQHYRGLMRMLGGSDHSALEGMLVPPWLGRPLRAVLITGSLTAQQKEQVRADAAHGGADIVVGTHALLEEDVKLPRLGMAVVDEQHRFGVMQRVKLRQKGLNPHLLVMTATPIPRTLALTVYGDLEVSTIDQLPPGRKPIATTWYGPHQREEAYRKLRARLDEGEQCYVICPLVEESEVLDARSAEEEYERLRTGPLRNYRVDLLHGRMPGKQKDEVMGRFARHETDVLVSTSVIEVGIDVPNATVIIIEGAERFGLSQLHQFRGRVGRSEKQSYCFLFGTAEDPGPEARERLEAMVETTDGFKLAEVDLAMRGEGEAWGRVQSGANSMLRVAKLTDRDILYRARELAAMVLARDPMLQKVEHRPLAAMVKPFLEKATEAN